MFFFGFSVPTRAFLLTYDPLLIEKALFTYDEIYLPIY